MTSPRRVGPEVVTRNEEPSLLTEQSITYRHNKKIRKSDIFNNFKSLVKYFVIISPPESWQSGRLRQS